MEAHCEQSLDLESAPLFPNRVTSGSKNVSNGQKVKLKAQVIDG